MFSEKKTEYGKEKIHPVGKCYAINIEAEKRLLSRVANTPQPNCCQPRHAYTAANNH